MSQLRKWTRRLAAVGVVTPLTVGGVEAQDPPGAGAVPMFVFAIDPAAIAAGLRPLRKTSLPPGGWEVVSGRGSGSESLMRSIRYA